ncbi:tRNA (guanosine(46)-N(7))-methyltransferase TrmB [Accumulibacter sp.]|uniref:tRNA (guanine(46)-N(7))-methyltransferase TrmB n=1 Tax=Accumulibacter sp. TaxID=2053492 RepID=UPI0025D0F7C3|nr:methyltransferase domain-containing protein [Accumulibacter sp.]MCM8595872.1 methyltransferase domain-containing protein [Accumulibacter sp.]MCM8627563.1 methyltransferase domain-containing protein [Accumulibacter sp.]MDS4050020.1 methyltransferase domain-containing protein [Accumulibacter sp.]
MSLTVFANSRVPESAQTGVHEQLPALLERHRATLYRRPVAEYSRRAFAASLSRVEEVGPGCPLILDSGCGVGESSVHLARRFPGHYVIGVDQSAVRLARGRRSASRWPDNLDLVRADLVDYWRLLDTAGLRLDRHYLLYPNPWPKRAHLVRRWHGHPVFPTLVALGGVLECRSNWAVYVAELCLAVCSISGRECRCEDYVPLEPMSPFERKYLASGHPLFRMVVDLGSRRFAGRAVVAGREAS